MSSSLDASETSASIIDDEGQPEILTLYSSERQRGTHAPFAADRERIFGALAFSAETSHRTRAKRIALCCACSTARVASDGRLWAALDRCRDRMCPLCARRRGIEVANDLADRCARQSTVRFLTLTLKASDDPLVDRIRHILECFKRFRQLPAIKAAIDGGARCIEVTRGQSLGHWHVHLHCLISGDFIAQKFIKRCWHEITGDSFVVDIRAVHDRKDAVRYMASYIAKPTRLRDWSDAMLREYCDALTGVRMVQCWGTWHKAPVDVDIAPEPPVQTAHVCGLNRLHRLWRKGSQVAADLVHRLAAMDKSFRVALGVRFTPEEIAEWSPAESMMPMILDRLEVLDQAADDDATAFDERCRGRVPVPRDPHRQRAFEWMPQPRPDPDPLDVAKWAEREGLGSTWNV